MSVLPTVSKVFERIMHGQMSIFVEKILSPGYIKDFSTQQTLSPLIETWKKVLDRNEYGGAVPIYQRSLMR